MRVRRGRRVPPGPGGGGARGAAAAPAQPGRRRHLRRQLGLWGLRELAAARQRRLRSTSSAGARGSAPRAHPSEYSACSRSRYVSHLLPMTCAARRGERAEGAPRYRQRRRGRRGRIPGGGSARHRQRLPIAARERASCAHLAAREAAHGDDHPAALRGVRGRSPARTAVRPLARLLEPAGCALLALAPPPLELRRGALAAIQRPMAPQVPPARASWLGGGEPWLAGRGGAALCDGGGCEAAAASYELEAAEAALIVGIPAAMLRSGVWERGREGR